MLSVTVGYVTVRQFVHTPDSYLNSSFWFYRSV